MRGHKRSALEWLGVSVCALGVIALVAVAALDLDTGDRIGSVVGAVAAVVGLIIAVAGRHKEGDQRGTGADPRRPKLVVRADGDSSIAAGRSITGNAIGRYSKVTKSMDSDSAPAAPHDASDREVNAKGSSSLAAGQDIDGNAIGEGSES